MASQSMTQRPPSQTRSGNGPMADCARTCNETLAYCLEQGGNHVEAQHIKAMIDCVQVCTLTAQLEERKSPLSARAMELCAQACKSCEESCEGFADDETMRRCADACRACREHCEQ